jgi:hypothetical protein
MCCRLSLDQSQLTAALFVPQRHHGINSRGPPGGNITSNDTDHDQCRDHRD